MKNLIQTLVEYLAQYINWLKNTYFYERIIGKKQSVAIKFKSYDSYGFYMANAIADLGVNPKQFLGINNTTILNAMLTSLQNSFAFQKRTKKLQSDITSAFKAYIKYKMVK